MTRRQEQVRLRNLERLVAEAGSAAELARLAETNPAYLSQIRRQLTTPKGTPRQVGDDLAEKLERAMGKPDGWMDESHTKPEDARRAKHDASEAVETPARYPLITWAQARRWPEVSRRLKRKDAADWLPSPFPCSQATFVLRVTGESMEPSFHDGDLIFVDPEVSPDSGRYVIVRLTKAREPLFRQLIIEAGNQYIKALNADWPNRIIAIDERATICGVVVFKGEVV